MKTFFAEKLKHALYKLIHIFHHEMKSNRITFVFYQSHESTVHVVNSLTCVCVYSITFSFNSYFVTKIPILAKKHKVYSDRKNKKVNCGV